MTTPRPFHERLAELVAGIDADALLISWLHAHLSHLSLEAARMDWHLHPNGSEGPHEETHCHRYPRTICVSGEMIVRMQDAASGLVALRLLADDIRAARAATDDLSTRWPDILLGFASDRVLEPAEVPTPDMT